MGNRFRGEGRAVQGGRRPARSAAVGAGAVRAPPTTTAQSWPFLPQGRALAHEDAIPVSGAMGRRHADFSAAPEPAGAALKVSEG